MRPADCKPTECHTASADFQNLTAGFGGCGLSHEVYSPRTLFIQAKNVQYLKIFRANIYTRGRVNL